MKVLKYEAQAEIYDDPSANFEHPYLTYAKFIYTDDKPNQNKKGVEYEDFPLIKLTAIGMPVKMRFLANQLGGHKASVPIGHIQDMVDIDLPDGTHQLMAHAALWSREFPDEIEYLRKEHKAGRAPSVSYEMGYDREEQKNGVGWYKGLVAQAATFVKFPSYGKRTALLALASLDLSEKELAKELTAMAGQIISDEGGTNVSKEEELQTEVEGLKAQITELSTKHTANETALQTAQAEIQSKDEVIKEYERVNLVNTRTQKVAEAGIKLETDPDKLKVRQDFWASLSDDVFTHYVSDLSAALKLAPKQQALASTDPKPAALPRLTSSNSDQTDFAGLTDRLRKITGRYPITSE